MKKALLIAILIIFSVGAFLTTAFLKPEKSEAVSVDILFNECEWDCLWYVKTQCPDPEVRQLCYLDCIEFNKCRDYVAEN